LGLILGRALDLMTDTRAHFRSKRITIARGDDLSLIWEGSGLEVPRTENGNCSPGAR
jgi:hypothetical protein